MYGASAPLHFVRRILDVLRRRLRRRGGDLHDVQRLLAPESVARSVARTLPPAEREAALYRAGRTFTRPQYRASFPGDLLTHMASELMKVDDHLEQLILAVSKKDMDLAAQLAPLFADAVSHVRVVADIVQCVVEEWPRPHSYPMAITTQKH